VKGYGICMSDFKVKLKEANNNEVKYSISYSSRKMPIQLVSFKIIGALKANTDVVLEISSEQIYKDNEMIIEMINRLCEYLEKSDIQYRKKKVLISRVRKVLSIPIENKKIEGFELIVFVPGELWKDTEIYKYLPPIGIKYFFIPKEADIDIDKFVAFSELERKEICEMQVFDNTAFENMGIQTETLSLNNINERINTK
jgi:hypothetical protein